MAPIVPVRRPFAALALVAVSVACWASLSTPANATPRAADDLVQVTAGWEGLARPGKLLPVRVSLSGAAASSPTVEIRVQSGNGGTTITKVPVTRRGGAGLATAAVSAPRDLGTFEVAVAATHGATTDQGKATVNPIGDEELVGVLPKLAQQAPPPATEPLTVPVGTARFTTVDLATLGVVGTLEPLGTLAATGDELAALDESQRLNVVSWLAGGGRLLVDDLDGPVAGLPEAWQPTTAEPRVSAALGEVRLTGGQLAAGRWATEIEPTPTISPADPDIVSPSFAGGEIGQSIAKDSGLRIPSLGTVLAFLLGYILLAGPITFFVLHKLHRAELAWVIVPLLAIGFTVGGWWIGGNARDNSRTAYSASVFETDGVDLDQTFVGVLSRQGGDRSVAFPGTWWGGNVANELYGRPEAQVVTTMGTRAVSTVSLVGGEFAVLGGRGPTDPTRQLQITASSDDQGAVAGTVRNTTDRLLHQVAVFVGNRSVLVGDLPAGGSKSFRVTAPAATGEEAADLQAIYGAPEAKVWPVVATQTVDQRSGPVDLALWGEATRQLGPDLRTPGSAVAVGWAGDLDPTAGLGPAAEGRTAVIARSTVMPGSKLTGMDVRRDLLRGPAKTQISDGSGPTAGAVFRFVLPPGTAATADDLQLSVPVTLSRVDVWNGERWETIVGSDGTTGTAPAAVTPSFEGPPDLVDLPPAAVDDGVIYVRVAVRLNGPSNSTGELLVSQR